ncbi:MAG: hypothetical protein ACOYLN_16850, partial [Blastocatellia bacterium]
MANFIKDKQANTTCTWQVDVDPPLDCCGTPISGVTFDDHAAGFDGDGEAAGDGGGAEWEKK